MALVGGRSQVTKADATSVTVLDPTLQVTTVLNAGISQPTGIVFLGSAEDYLVLEKGLRPHQGRGAECLSESLDRPTGHAPL